MENKKVAGVCEGIRLGCPNCQAVAVKNGIGRGGQAWRCKRCGHEFMGDPGRRRLPAVVVDIIKALLADGVAPAKIARAVGISVRQAYAYKRGING